MPAAAPGATHLLIYALIAIAALVLAIARFRVNPFVALTLASLGLGIAAGMPLTKVAASFQAGVGNVLGYIAVVVALGTMLGKLLAESGGAERIALTMLEVFGERRAPWAMMVIAFIVGLPVFFEVGFVLLIPLVFTVARRTGKPLVLLGLPMVAGLSVVHGLIPPHPAAMLATGMYKANVGLTILYGVIVGLPAAILAGPLYAQWIAPRIHLPPENPIATQLIGEPRANLPSFGVSLFTILLPVFPMLAASLADLTLAKTLPVRHLLDFLGTPMIALLMALIVAFWSFGFRRGFDRDQILRFTTECLAPTAVILLVIGAGGGFNRVLLDSGVGKAIAELAQHFHLSLLLLAFLVAGLVRIATGSATVALTTAAGIIAPIAAMAPDAARPELLVLATGAGSILLSHVNDSGFWMIKQYFNMSVPQTLKTWTVLETILAVSTLSFTMILAKILAS